MSNDYTGSVRRMLVDNASRSRPAPRRALLVGALIFAISGAATGGAVAAIVPSGEPEVVPYVIGTPATEFTTVPLDYFGETVVRTGAGDETFDLGERPDGATLLVVEFQCGSPGEFSWKPSDFVADGNQTYTCTAERIAAGPAADAARTTYELDAGAHSFDVTASPQATWTLSTTWARPRPIEWKTNDTGQTYGMRKSDDTVPDLLAQVGTNVAGNSVEGYLRSADLGHAGMLKLYASDGVTVLGTVDLGDE